VTLVSGGVITGNSPADIQAAEIAITAAGDVEIRDRIARYDRGEIGTRSAGEVFSDLDRRLRT